jgi:hypothetical protein
MLYVALIVASLLQPNTPGAAGHPSFSILHWRRASFPTAPMPRKPSHVAPVRVVFRRFASSPTVPSRAVSVRVACSLRCALRVLPCMLHPCMFHQRALHACCIVSSVHRKRAALTMAHRRVVRCAACCACAARLGEGRAVAVAERRRDALVRSPTAACSPWPRARRCSTPWRYPAPQQGCVRGQCGDAQLG